MVTLRPVCFSARRIARHFSSSIVIGFSQITSFPALSPLIMYSWWKVSCVTTISVSNSTSRSIASKSWKVGTGAGNCALV